MRLVEQWRQIEAGLPEDWDEVIVSVIPEEAPELPNVAAMLGPMGPSKVGDGVRLTVRRAGGASGPEAARRLFGLLDDRRVWSTIEQERVTERPQPIDDIPSPSLVAQLEACLDELPADWSDLLCEISLDSSDYLARAALLCSPINPTRSPEGLAFTFRMARETGYGVSAVMARRCFERCDAETITGQVRVLRALSDSDGVMTQGPVWYVAGKAL